MSAPVSTEFVLRTDRYRCLHHWNLGNEAPVDEAD